MKKDTRTFLYTMITIPALLATATGVHAFFTPSTNAVAGLQAFEVPVYVATTTLPEPVRVPTPVPVVVHTSTAAPKKSTPRAPASVPAPVVVAPPVVVKPAPAQPTVVYRTVVRSRTTSAS